MLTNLTIRNFKRFSEVEIELGNAVVFIGPNNSGKTSVMQALALWEIGLKRWNEKYSGKKAPEKRPGVTVNRRDLIAVPVPHAGLLWRERRTRDKRRVDGDQHTNNIRIDVIVKGIGAHGKWTCGLEFDFANQESFYCRPLRMGKGRTPDRMTVPEEAAHVRTAFLPPMSGLAATETRLDHGAVNVRVGEGRTAEVLRNLCYRIHEERPDDWDTLVGQIQNLFGATLKAARYVEARGEISMSYVERDIQLDLSSSGRGLQQTLLILAYMYANPGAVLLLDEPDAHLEILRQRQIYRLLTEAASKSGSQIIAASHSEVLLNEAAGRHMVIAFVGAPHRIDDRGSQTLKALNEIGFEDYYQAEQKGWILYLEGSTDLSILQAFAQRLAHADANRVLEQPFVRYVGNRPVQVERHYYGLREACPDLQAVALFDRIEPAPTLDGVECLIWERREIENYFCTRAALENYARESAESSAFGPLFAPAEIDRRVNAMHEAIEKIRGAMKTLAKGSPWSHDAKVSDEFLTPVFERYYRKLDLPNLMRKKSFYELAEYVPCEEIDDEIRDKLDAIVRVAESARPVTHGY